MARSRDSLTITCGLSLVLMASLLFTARTGSASTLWALTSAARSPGISRIDERFSRPALNSSSLAQANETQEAYFVFDCPTHPETFVFKLTDPAKIEQARAILNGTGRGMVSGVLIKHPVYYNSPWSFYLDPKSISFPDMAVEVCDSSIRGIEDHLDSAYPSWCPWCTRLLREIPPPPKPVSGNISPAATMTQPYVDNLPRLTAPVTMTLMAAADDPDGTISKVEFFEGHNKIGEDTTYPYGITWSTPRGGTYHLSARATDNEGATGASKSITFTPDSAPSNPIDQTSFFVRQHYQDFLNREPEPSGLQGWINILNNCPQGSIACDRIEVSSAFFRSTEFQDRGGFPYRVYSVSLGRFPHYNEFMPDLARLSGFQTPDEQEQNKRLFIQDFMARAEFQARYNGTTNQEYVNRIEATAQVALPNRQDLIDALDRNLKTRAEVLREIAESAEVRARFYAESFVVMQYFGYLRRDPDALYLDWIRTMNADPNNYRIMVNGFMNSAEYRNRFWP